MLFYYEPKVFWTLGGNGTTIRLFTDLDEKISLFDLSFYEDPKNDPTVKYLTKHSIDEIFADKTLIWYQTMSVSLRLVHGSEKHLIGYTESDK